MSRLSVKGKKRTGMAECLQLAPEVLNTELSSLIWRVEKEPLRVLGVRLGSWAPLSVSFLTLWGGIQR